MEYVILPVVALIGSLLTFFSGFGLGTLLLPVFAIFFPLSIAITMTAIIHLFNNVFKAYLVGKHTDWNIVFKFGLVAVCFAFVGAWVLAWLSHVPPLGQYYFYGKIYFLNPLKIILGILLIVFSTLELKSDLFKSQLMQQHLFIGGMLSGFFGGLSGFQGALRSIFLVNCKLSKEQFIATGVIIACLVDLARIPAYGFLFTKTIFKENVLLLIITVLAASCGAYFGNIVLRKTSIGFIRNIITIFIYFISIGLISGLI